MGADLADVVRTMTNVTDHAVLRHLQRTYGVDVEFYRGELATRTVDLAIEKGFDTVIGTHGERLKIRDGRVVTVLTKRMRRMPS